MNNEKIDFIEKVFIVTMHNFFKTIEPKKEENSNCSIIRDKERDVIHFNMRVGEQTIKAYVACHSYIESYSKILREFQFGERNYITLDVIRLDGKRLELFRTEKTTPKKVYLPILGNDLIYLQANRLQDEEMERNYIKDMFSISRSTDNIDFKHNNTKMKPENVELIYDDSFIEEIEKKYEEIKPIYENIGKVMSKRKRSV